MPPIFVCYIVSIKKRFLVFYKKIEPVSNKIQARKPNGVFLFPIKT